jgi:hypothetical protein
MCQSPYDEPNNNYKNGKQHKMMRDLVYAGQWDAQKPTKSDKREHPKNSTWNCIKNKRYVSPFAYSSGKSSQMTKAKNEVANGGNYFSNPLKPFDKLFLRVWYECIVFVSLKVEVQISHQKVA